jgi:hypothetical protein
MILVFLYYLDQLNFPFNAKFPFKTFWLNIIHLTIYIIFVACICLTKFCIFLWIFFVFIDVKYFIGFFMFLKYLKF